MDGTCSQKGEMRSLYEILVRKPKGKRTLGRPRRRSKNNINADLKKIRWQDVGWFTSDRTVTGG
jgi:hypothetical protein